MRLGVLLSLILLGSIAPKAQACTCDDIRPWTEVAQSDALFTGQLIEAKLTYVIPEAPWLRVPETLWTSLRPNSVKLIFEVERYWTGSGQRRAEVFTDLSSCALDVPDLGSTMLIEAEAYRSTLFTFLCLRSLPVYSGGEVQHMASRSEFAGYRLLTRDSLRVYLGDGGEPSRGPRWWFVVTLLASLVLVFCWNRFKVP